MTNKSVQRKCLLYQTSWEKSCLTKYILLFCCNIQVLNNYFSGEYKNMSTSTHLFQDYLSFNVAFFKRTVRDKKTYTCVCNKKIKGRWKTRAYCRFQKCLTLGMTNKSESYVSVRDNIIWYMICFLTYKKSCSGLIPAQKLRRINFRMPKIDLYYFHRFS